MNAEPAEGRSDARAGSRIGPIARHPLGGSMAMSPTPKNGDLPVLEIFSDYV